ncbi:MAG TPA: ribonuclease III [Burkholderiales bacterium]|jgi:ribonuclease-3|nr:ribonuclease III [Burkholderiales bacterium]
MDLDGFSRTIGYRFNDPELLLRALTHRSYTAEHNERLEFLGDSVVNCAVALQLYRKFPLLTEGELSRLRASLVSQPSLAAIAAVSGFGVRLRLGEGELKSGGARRPSMLADAVEAVIGAVFLDGGFDAAYGVVEVLFSDALQKIDPKTTGKDAKTLLQEYLQSRRLPLPRYAVITIRGEAHDQMFEVECEIEQLDIRARGEGTSRRSAEQEAAGAAYQQATHHE